MRKLPALALIVILMSFGLIVYGVAHRPKPGDQDEVLAVKNWKGEYIGSVQHVLLDSSTGNITFIVLSLDEGKKEIVLPLSAFSSYHQENRTLILSISKGILTAAPEFHVSDLSDPAFLDRVHRFFGEVPPWTDRPTERERNM